MIEKNEAMHHEYKDQYLENLKAKCKGDEYVSAGGHIVKPVKIYDQEKKREYGMLMTKKLYHERKFKLDQIKKKQEKLDFNLLAKAESNAMFRAKAAPVRDEVERQCLSVAAAWEKKNDDAAKMKRQLESDDRFYGHQGVYIKRRGQLDQFTVNNPNYPYSLAHGKYVLIGSEGWFPEKDMLPWHARIDQTRLNARQDKIKWIPE